MNHIITKFPSHEGPLPIPHCFQFPEYSPAFHYDVIVPSDLELSEGDGIYFTSMPIGGPEVTVKKIIERRPAKGDWSQQAVHKNPHFVRFIAK
jgi:hypothetical protein